MRNGAFTAVPQFGDTISGFFVIFGGDGDDILTGDDNRNTLDGGPGADTVNGLGGEDFLRPAPASITTSSTAALRPATQTTAAITTSSIVGRRRPRGERSPRDRSFAAGQKPNRA